MLVNAILFYDIVNIMNMKWQESGIAFCSDTALQNLHRYILFVRTFSVIRNASQASRHLLVYEQERDSRVEVALNDFPI